MINEDFIYSISSTPSSLHLLLDGKYNLDNANPTPAPIKFNGRRRKNKYRRRQMPKRVRQRS